MFFDEVALELEGGRGGSGMVNFHREKFVSAGPPDGGDGGEGGGIVLVADGNHNTFRHFAGRKSFKAEGGVDGHKNNRTGRGGEDLELKVPVGTLVYAVREEGEDELLADLREHGQQVVVARGGRGGHGNANFVSSIRQAPNFAELGDVGEHVNVRFELQLVADVGLVGFPSAGKSTLISHVSAAKPKIGSYPFTTLIPNLGVVNLSQFGGSDQQSFVIADMPGIIEGASDGKGLGDAFLKHISRTATIVYLLDPFSYDDRSIVEQFGILLEELRKYNPALLEKEQLVVMNKIDAIPDEDREELKAEFLKAFPDWADKFKIASAVSGEDLNSLMFDLWNLAEKGRQEAAEAEEAAQDQEDGVQEHAAEAGAAGEGEVPDYKPRFFMDDKSFGVEKMYEVGAEDLQEPVHGRLISEQAMPQRKLFAVKGDRIQQISRMTNTDQPEAIGRIYDVLQKMGIQDELRRAGAKTGDYVKIEPHIFEFHDLTEG